MFNLKKYNQINYKYLGFFLVTLISVILTYRNLPFIDHDTVIYTIIGRDIFESLSMPYDRTFDHKPIFTYYIYGIFSYILNNNLYLMVSIFCCLSSSLILCKKNINNFLILSSFLIIGSTLFSNLSGNTEILMLPFISAYLLFFKGNSSLKFLAIGGLASILFNINYLAAIVMMPITLYMFHSNNYKVLITNITIFLCGFLIVTLIIFLPFLILDQSISEYFRLQFNFITSYSGSNRIDSLVNLLKFIFILLPIVTAYVILSERTRTFFLISLLFLGSVLGALASGHGFSHYLTPTIIPIALMVITLIESKKILAVIAVAPLLLGTTYLTIKRYTGTHEAAYLMSTKGKRDIAHLDSLASTDNTALNIGSSHVTYLFSKARNINKYIFPGHVQIIHRAGANSYYESQIDRKPHLIMTKIDMCKTRNKLCESIKRDYQYDSTANYAYGYDLYKLKK